MANTSSVAPSQLIEMVEQNKKAEIDNAIDRHSQSLPQKWSCANLAQFISETPNKLFWLSSFIVLCIGIIVSEIAYKTNWANAPDVFLSFNDNSGQSQDIKTGHKPAFAIFVIGFIVFCGYFIACMKELFYKQPKQDKSKLTTNKITPKWTKQSTMYVIKKRIEGVVIDAFETECDKKKVDNEKLRREIALKRATHHVKEGYNGVDIISQCQLESVDRRSSFLSLLFKIRNHYFWTVFMHIVVITHVSWAFYESKTYRTETTWPIFGRLFYVGTNMKAQDAIPEFFFLAIELFDVFVRILWIHLCPTHVLRAKSEKLYAYLNLYVLIYIFADLIINIQFSKSLEYLIPVRPLLLILMNNNLRTEVATLIGSIYEILPVLRVYALVVIFCGIMALIIFGDQTHSVQALQTEFIKSGSSTVSESDSYVSLKENIDCFWYSLRSILTMFVFVSSGENYTTVVYPGMQIHSGLVLLFFVPVIFCGLFSLMALITGIFEDVFVKKEAVNRMRDLWWRRTGIISAFLLIDSNNSDGLLTLDEFIEFVLFLRKNKKDHINRLQIFKLFKLLDTDNSGAIELSEFVTGIEKLCDDYNGFDRYVIDRIISSEKHKQKCSNLYNILAIIEMCWDSWAMNKLRGFIFLFNFWVFCGMNIIEQNIFLNTIKIFLFIHISDVFIKCLVMKPYRYLYYSKFNKNEIISEFANRADLIIASVCLIGYSIGIFLYLPSNHIYFNIFCALILLRVFVFWNISLRFLFMIKCAFASLSALFIVMFCVFFAYGTIGVSLFKGKTEEFEKSQDYMKNGYGNANFDCLENAMITLVQAFVGEAFHEIMLATKKADGDGENWIICFYIVSYFLIMTLLFGNLFFGLLLSIFGALYDIAKSGKKLTNHTVQKASQLRLNENDTSESEETMSTAGDEGIDITKDRLYLKSRARKESVTLDIVEPIPEEMAHNLSIGNETDCDKYGQQMQLQRTITDFNPNNNRPLTPTGTEFGDSAQITKTL